MLTEGIRIARKAGSCSLLFQVVAACLDRAPQGPPRGRSSMQGSTPQKLSGAGSRRPFSRIITRSIRLAME
jgi:hypothetical protein